MFFEYKNLIFLNDKVKSDLTLAKLYIFFLLKHYIRLLFQSIINSKNDIYNINFEFLGLVNQIILFFIIISLIFFEKFF